MSYLGFGGKAITGGAGLGLPLPADPNCNANVTATSWQQALGNDNPIHGGWGTNNTCGDDLRNTFVPQFEAATQLLALYGNQQTALAEPHAGSERGASDFPFWPAWNDILHQKMWVDWIRRAWTNGQRVMVALAVNNKTTAESFSGPGDGPNDDKTSADLQISAMTTLVGASDFMEIALSSADINRIVTAGKLAIVLGMEVDNIGNFNTVSQVTSCENLGPNCAGAESTVSAEIQRLYNEGVRYLFPIHIIDNPFGGTGVYEGLFDISNALESGAAWALTCAVPSDGIRFDGSLGSLSTVLLVEAYMAAKLFPSWTVPPPPSCPGSGVQNTRGLTALGGFAIQEMMRRGMFVDIDHMSESSANQALTIAEKYGYPMMSGHNSVRGTPPEPSWASTNGESENQRTLLQLNRIAALHGMLGLGSAGLDAYTWITDYAQATLSIPAPGAVSFGTDMDGMVLGSPPRQGSQIAYSTAFPMSTLGSRSWNYNTDGVAHYGMLPEFIQDARTQPTSFGTAGTLGVSMVDGHLNFGADYFYKTWIACEQAAGKVPQAQAQALRAPVCTSGDLTGCYVQCTWPTAPRNPACSTLEAACRGGNAGACASLGFAYGSVTGTASKAFVSTYEHACHSDTLQACEPLGAFYASASYGQQNFAEARAYLQRACSWGDGRGCVALGSLYEQGQGVAKKEATAVMLYRKACRGVEPGKLAGCSALTRLKQPK
jgi:hypothetical protein